MSKDKLTFYITGLIAGSLIGFLIAINIVKPNPVEIKVPVKFKEIKEKKVFISDTIQLSRYRQMVDSLEMDLQVMREKLKKNEPPFDWKIKEIDTKNIYLKILYWKYLKSVEWNIKSRDTTVTVYPKLSQKFSWSTFSLGVLSGLGLSALYLFLSR